MLDGLACWIDFVSPLDIPDPLSIIDADRTEPKDTKAFHQVHGVFVYIYYTYIYTHACTYTQRSSHSRSLVSKTHTVKGLRTWSLDYRVGI